jgi:hypothetical protein
MAGEIDGLEDELCEIAAAILVRSRLPFPMTRQLFGAAVGSVCIEALRTAAADGRVAELLGDSMPLQSNLELVARLLAEIIDADNPRLHAKCIDFVLGIGLCQGMSETQIARDEGVGKAAVSKRCKLIQKAFGLLPSRGMKSERACENYAERQKGKRAKPLPQPWAFSGLLGRACNAA